MNCPVSEIDGAFKQGSAYHFTNDDVFGFGDEIGYNKYYRGCEWVDLSDVPEGQALVVDLYIGHAEVSNPQDYRLKAECSVLPDRSPWEFIFADELYDWIGSSAANWEMYEHWVIMSLWGSVTTVALRQAH